MSDWEEKIDSAIRQFRSVFIEDPRLSYVQSEREIMYTSGQNLAAEVENLRTKCERLEGEKLALLRDNVQSRLDVITQERKRLREALEECKKWATDPYKAPELIPQLVIETVDAALAGTDAKGER